MKNGPPAARRGGHAPEPSQSVAGCLIQLAWSLGGAGALVVLAVTISRGPPWSFTVKDVLYWTAVLGMIAARHVDVVRYHGRTTTGEPATARDVRVYALGLLLGAGVLWCLAQFVHV